MPPTETLDLCLSPRSAECDLCIANRAILCYVCFSLFLLSIVSLGLGRTLMHVLLIASLIELDIFGNREEAITVFKIKGQLTLINQILDTS